MTAQELRIGNWVLFYGEFSQVEGIDSYGCSLNNGFAKYTLPNLKPIPLTEEILLNCGFVIEDKKYKYFSYKDIAGILHLFDGVAEYSIDSNDVCWVNNVHQLQNLFFALNGKELEINIK